MRVMASTLSLGLQDNGGNVRSELGGTCVMNVKSEKSGRDGGEGGGRSGKKEGENPGWEI